MAGGGDALTAGPLGRREASPEGRVPTTLSTIAVQSGTTRIVIALLQSREWVELKVLEMTPDLTQLGSSLEESLLLQKQHEEVLQKLASKQSPVEELLNQADQLIANQKPKAEVYSAMAESLGLAWRDLNGQLELRRQLLAQSVNFHSRSRNFSDCMDLAERVFGEVTIPPDAEAAREAIRQLVDVKKSMLEASMYTLQEGNLLLEKLRQLAARGTIDSRPNQIRNTVQSACAQVERWLEELHDRRRCLEVLFANRKTILEQNLALSKLYADLGSVQKEAELRRRDLSTTCQLGESASSAEILLYEHNKLELEAKTIQDRALHLLRAAETLVQAGTYAREEPRARAYAALDICTQLIDAAELRRNLLTCAAEFFTAAQQAFDKMLLLESELQSAPASQLPQVHGRVAACLPETAAPALLKGNQLLDQVGRGKDGTEGVSRCMSELQRRLEDLSIRCTAHKEENIRRTQMLNDFVEKHNELSNWLVSVGDSFLRNHTNMGQALEPAKEFGALHEQMRTDTITKGKEIDSLLYQLPPLLERLEPEQTQDLQRKAEDLRAQWTSLQRLIDVRQELIEPYVSFHQQAASLQTAVDNLRSSLDRPDLTDEDVKRAEDSWLKLQQNFHQLTNTGRTFIERAQQSKEPYLDLRRACLCVELILDHLRSEQLRVTETYEQIQMTVTSSKQFQKDWQQCKQDAKDTQSWVSRLESDLYPVLRQTDASLEQRLRQCEQKTESVVPMLQKAQSELEHHTRTAEKLRDKGDTKGEADQLLKDLADKKDKISATTTDYQMILQMMTSYFKNLKEVDSSIQKQRTRDATRPLPSEPTECQLALREHESTQQAFTELFRFAGSEKERIEDKVKQVEPPAAAEHDIRELRHALDKQTDTWEETWQSKKQKLEERMSSSMFNSELEAINTQLNELSGQLSSMRGQYGETLREAKQTSQAFRTFEDSIQSTGKQIQNFVSTAQTYVNASPEPEKVVLELEQLQNKWSIFYQQVGDNRKLIDLAVEYHTLVEEMEDWYKEGGKLLVEVARKSTQARTPEDVQNLRSEINLFLTPGEQDQEKRIRRITVMAEELYGTGRPPRVVTVTEQSHEMIESFKTIRRELQAMEQTLKQMEREREELRREKDEMSASIRAAQQEAEAARAAASAADEARRAAEAAARALEDMPRPVTPLVVPKVDVCTETITLTKRTVDRSTQEIPVGTADAYTQEEGVVRRDAGTQDAIPWEEPVTKTSEPGPQVSPPKRQKKAEEEPRPVAPVFTVPLMDQTVQEGVRHTLEARVDGFPPPKINWQRDGISCDHNPDYAITNQQGVCTLTIEETLVEDSATFTCRAWNSAGVAETSGKLTVREHTPEEELAPPIFTRQLRDTGVKEGRPAQLEATVTGNPLPTVTWLHNDTCIDTSQDYVITYNNGECVLRIEEALPQDQGSFTCRASNQLGTDQTTAKLRVEPRTPAEAPKFVVPLSNVMARAGQKLRLECEVTGLPHPDLTWLHNHRPVREGRDTRITYDGRKATLTIPEAFPKDAGTYVIVAKNTEGEATCSCSVTVKGRLPTETSDSEMASDMEPIKPHIRVQLHDLTVEQGDRAQLDCVITGQPEPEVIWYHGEQPVKESKDFQLLFQGDRCTLIISSAVLDDAGPYTVVAINSAGEAKSTCTLNVLPPRTPTPEEVTESPKFTRLLSDATATEGERQVLEAEVTGLPEPTVSWLKDGREIKSTESVKLTKDGQKVRLEIGSVLPQHSGNYICVATNKAGEARCFSHVLVRPLPRPQQVEPAKPPPKMEPPTFVQIFKDQHVATGKDVMFQCIIDGKPRPTVEWLFEDGPLPSKKFVPSSEGQHHVLRIRSPELLHTGRVKCVAENDIGKATCAAHLTVEEPVHVVDAPLEKRIIPASSKDTSKAVTMKKTMYTEFHEETQVVNGDKKTKRRGTQERSEETHSSVADQPDEQIKRTTYEEIAGDEGAVSQKRSELVRQEEGLKKKATQEQKKPKRPPQPPRFITPLQGVIVKQGGSVKFEGVFTGYPPPEITWYKDGLPLTPADRPVISHDQSRVTLTMDEVGDEDAGKYTCNLENEAGTATSTADVVVRKSLFPPVFDHRLKAQVATPGQRVFMEVTVSGTPAPEVKWFKNGEPLTSSETVTIKQEGSRHILVIPSVTHEDAGKYSVQATNPAGEATSIADFVVADEMPVIIERRLITQDMTEEEYKATLEKDASVKTGPERAAAPPETKRSPSPEPKSEPEPEPEPVQMPPVSEQEETEEGKILRVVKKQVIVEEEEETVQKPKKKAEKQETRARDAAHVTKEEKMRTGGGSVDLSDAEQPEKVAEKEVIPTDQPDSLPERKEDKLQKLAEIASIPEPTPAQQPQPELDDLLQRMEEVQEEVTKTTVDRTPVIPALPPDQVEQIEAPPEEQQPEPETKPIDEPIIKEEKPPVEPPPEREPEPEPVPLEEPVTKEEKPPVEPPPEREPDSEPEPVEEPITREEKPPVEPPPALEPEPEPKPVDKPITVTPVEPPPEREPEPEPERVVEPVTEEQEAPVARPERPEGERTVQTRRVVEEIEEEETLITQRPPEKPAPEPEPEPEVEITAVTKQSEHVETEEEEHVEQPIPVEVPPTTHVERKVERSAAETETVETERWEPGEVPASAAQPPETTDETEVSEHPSTAKPVETTELETEEQKPPSKQVDQTQTRRQVTERQIIEDVTEMTSRPPAEQPQPRPVEESVPRVVESPVEPPPRKQPPAPPPKPSQPLQDVVQHVDAPPFAPVQPSVFRAPEAGTQPPPPWAQPVPVQPAPYAPAQPVTHKLVQPPKTLPKPAPKPEFPPGPPAEPSPVVRPIWVKEEPLAPAPAPAAAAGPPPGAQLVLTYVARTGPPELTEYPPAAPPEPVFYPQQVSSSEQRSQQIISSTSRQEDEYSASTLSETDDERPRRHGSRVSDIKRRIETQLDEVETNGTTAEMRGGVRTFPVRTPELDRPQPVYPPPVQPVHQPRFQRFPELEPFPYQPPTQPLPPRHVRASSVPTPSKFVPGRSTESDYESDYDERIPTRWWPDGYEYIDRRFVCCCQKTHPRRVGDQGRPITPPSEFDRPPCLLHPPRPQVDLSAPLQPERKVAKKAPVQPPYLAPKREAPVSAPPPAQPTAPPTRPVKEVVKQWPPPPPTDEESSEVTRQQSMTEQRTVQTQQLGYQRPAWPPAAPQPDPLVSPGRTQTSQSSQQSYQKVSEQRSFQQPTSPVPYMPPVPLQTSQQQRSTTSSRTVSSSSQSFQRTSEQTGYQPAPQPTSTTSQVEKSSGGDQQSFSNRSQTYETLDRPGVEGYQATSQTEAGQFKREEGQGFTRTETKFEKSYNMRMEKTEVLDSSGRVVKSLTTPLSIAPPAMSPQPVITSPYSEVGSTAYSQQQSRLQQEQRRQTFGTPLSPQPVITSPWPESVTRTSQQMSSHQQRSESVNRTSDRLTSPRPAMVSPRPTMTSPRPTAEGLSMEKMWSTKKSDKLSKIWPPPKSEEKPAPPIWAAQPDTERPMSAVSFGSNVEERTYEAGGYVSDYAGYASEPELAALAARRPDPYIQGKPKPQPPPPPPQQQQQQKTVSQEHSSYSSVREMSQKLSGPPGKPPQAKPGPAVPPKFRKAEHKESDYESDYEARIPAKWTPTGPVEGTFRPVQPPSPSPRSTPQRQLSAPSVSSGASSPAVLEQRGLRPSEAGRAWPPSSHTTESRQSQLQQSRQTFQSQQQTQLPPQPVPQSIQSQQSQMYIQQQQMHSQQQQQMQQQLQSQQQMQQQLQSQQQQQQVQSGVKRTTTTTTTTVKKEFQTQRVVRQELQSSQPAVPGAVSVQPHQSPRPSRPIQPKPPLILKAAPPAKQQTKPLEPFPYKPEQTREKPPRGPPPRTPRKFKKGEVRECDCESDYEGRIAPVWRPADSGDEEPQLRPVRPELPDSEVMGIPLPKSPVTLPPARVSPKRESPPRLKRRSPPSARRAEPADSGYTADAEDTLRRRSATYTEPAGPSSQSRRLPASPQPQSLDAAAPGRGQVGLLSLLARRAKRKVARMLRRH